MLSKWWRQFDGYPGNGDLVPPPPQQLLQRAFQSYQNLKDLLTNLQISKVLCLRKCAMFLWI